MAMSFHRVFLAVAVWGVQGTARAQTTADFFDNSVLHQVEITMSASDWSSLKQHYLENTYYNVTSMKWTGGKGLTATVNGFQLRSRGHGSRSPVKPGLHLDFTKLTSALRFLGLQEVELKNNSQDPSMIHELISFELFARMGTPVSRVAPSKVFVNGEYIGLYNICESPADPIYVQRNFNDAGGYVYEYKPGSWLDTTNPSGQYHFEYLGPDLNTTSTCSGNPSGVCYSGPNGNVPFDPKTHSNAPDTVTLEKLIRTMNQASDADLIPALTAEPNAGALMDPNEFLTQVATETWLADFDCILGDIFGLNNFFLYRMAKTQFTHIAAWDKDNAFDWTGRPVLQNADQNVLMRRLVAIPQYKQFYFDQMAKVAMLAGGDGGWVRHEADRFYGLIKQAAYDDPNKTYLNSGLLQPTTNDHFESAVQAVRDFPGARASFVMQDLAKNGYQTPGNNPQIVDGSLISVVSNQAGAAGGLGALYGSNLGDAKSAAVYVNGFQSPIVFGSAGQIDLQIPWEAAGLHIPYGVIVNGQPSPIQFTNVQTYSPDVLAVAHQDGQTPVTAANPASAGETVVIYATGLGPVGGTMVTGQAASTTALQQTTQPATANMSSRSAAIVFSGLTPGFLGLYQVNATIPSGVSGTVFLDLSIGGATAPSVSFAVK
jgi:uncharacterized protein (TIGR03437 family)